MKDIVPGTLVVSLNGFFGVVLKRIDDNMVVVMWSIHKKLKVQLRYVDTIYYCQGPPILINEK